ncbi:MAG: oligosaccharide flippase family protein [Clostridia bacterium]|nr:oligosaccharide flippase family protein [Clostridia bacterium]
MKRSLRLFGDTLLLTAVSLAVRTSSLLFSSYVSRRAGAETVGLFSLVTSVSFFAVTFAVSGINLGVTRLVSEALGRGDAFAVRGCMRRAFLYLSFFGGIAALTLFSFAEPIARRLLSDARAAPSLRALAFSLPPIALSAALNGYFCAVRRVWKSAAAQLFEEAVSILVSAFLFSLLLPRGIGYACLALVAGSAVSETAAALLSLCFYLGDRSRRARGNGRDRGGWRALFAITLPVSLSAYVRSALVTVEHILIPVGLAAVASGADRALADYGVLSGMVLPTVLYPTAFSAAFSSLLVPEAASLAARGDRALCRETAKRAIGTILSFGIGAAGILISAAPGLETLLYPGTGAGPYIRTLAIVLPVMMLDTVTDGLLKGLGEQLWSMAVNIGDAFLSVLLVWLLLPRAGIEGYLFIVIFCEALNCFFSLTRLLSVTGARLSPFPLVLPPFLCVFAATRLSLFFLSRLPLSGGEETVLHLLFSAFLTLAFLLFLRGKHPLQRESACDKMKKKEKRRERGEKHGPDHRGKTESRPQHRGGDRQTGAAAGVS